MVGPVGIIDGPVGFIDGPVGFIDGPVGFIDGPVGIIDGEVRLKKGWIDQTNWSRLIFRINQATGEKCDFYRKSIWPHSIIT